MTRDELLRFMDDYLALLRKYGHSREDAPEGAQPMALRFLAVPEPDDVPGPPPDEPGPHG
jgi:hypothetical protein